MKGIPTFRPRRLKQAAVVTGVTALVAAASVLGTAQAHAATGVLGTDHGALVITNTAGQTSGSTSDSLKYSTTEGCPAGFQGSGELLLVDPNDNQDFDSPANINNSVATEFSGTITSSLAFEMQIFPQMQGTTSEYVEECFTGPSAGGTGEFVMDTFVTISADGNTYSFSATPPAGPPAAVNLTLTASPNPATSGQSVTLTATASASGATGTVNFEDNGTVVGTPNVPLSGGKAITTFTAPTVTSADTENLTAVYTPSGNFTAGTAGSLSLPVNPAPANSGTIPLAVSVPQSGSFSLSVDSTDVVTLTATDLTAAGSTTPITVADSRNSFPGWSVSGQDGDWTGTGTAAGGTFTGDQLGWTPTDTALAPAVTLGSAVTAANPGLGTTAATLASVHAGLGNGFGTSTLGADLSLVIPPTAPAGPYTSGLTISAVTSNP
jgi:hypothetical protein